MSEMVERVARVLKEQPYAQEHMETARAVIAAMREPTEGMLENSGTLYDASTIERWKRMIDEALK